MAWMWLLVLVLVVVAVVVKVRRHFRLFVIRQSPFHPMHEDARFRDHGARQPLSSSMSDTSGEVERMVCCEFCEVYVPVSEAVERSGKIFCCREHGIAYFSRKQAS